jgi:hypothetical protein
MDKFKPHLTCRKGLWVCKGKGLQGRAFSPAKALEAWHRVIQLSGLDRSPSK